jgi:hypothetical protein
MIISHVYNKIKLVFYITLIYHTHFAIIARVNVVLNCKGDITLDKKCIFNNTETCSECGECYACDLKSSKRCNNCGKCLEIEGYDIKSIQIDNILDNDEELLEFEEMDDLHHDANEIPIVNEEFWDYIDDIQGLKNLMQNDNELNLHEEFPGLLVYKKTKKNEEEGVGEE